MTLTVGGAKAEDHTIGTLTGPGLPGTLDAPLSSDLSIDVSYPIPKGSGT